MYRQTEKLDILNYRNKIEMFFRTIFLLNVDKIFPIQTHENQVKNLNGGDSPS